MLEARRVSRSFHATFSTSWRRYAYLLPRTPGMSPMDVADEAREIDRVLQPLAGAPGMPRWNRPSHTPIAYAHFVRQWLMSIPYADSIRRLHTPIVCAHATPPHPLLTIPPRAPLPVTVPGFGRARSGVARDYAALGRGLPRGKSTVTTLHHASARPVRLAGGGFATRVDLVGDRFLRRQVADLALLRSRAALPRCAPALRSRARRLSCMRASSRSRHAASCGTAECHHGNGT